LKQTFYGVINLTLYFCHVRTKNNRTKRNMSIGLKTFDNVSTKWLVWDVLAITLCCKNSTMNKLVCCSLLIFQF